MAPQKPLQLRGFRRFRGPAVRGSGRTLLDTSRKADLDRIPRNTFRIYRETDIENQEHGCGLRTSNWLTVHAPRGSTSYTMNAHKGALSLPARCHEHDYQNLGDCAVIGELLCKPN